MDSLKVYPQNAATARIFLKNTFFIEGSITLKFYKFGLNFFTHPMGEVSLYAAIQIYKFGLNFFATY